ncbi:MAG: hypothetical protein EP335_18365 [Alphaproteobacteria bacterium]|nr:MAG: hypothetical protein EP335_18365 [Alphaproteobacteria bacterium]
MPTSSFWRFGHFGPARDVMERVSGPLRPLCGGEAMVAIRAVGLNQAENRYLAGLHFPPDSLPACIGHEAVGEIVALGAPSERWKVGDRVALVPMLVDMPGMGALRDVGIYPLDALVPVPEDYSDSEGAAWWMAIFTMAGALEMAGFGPENAAGRTVCITAAAGGMGLVALRLLRAWGAITIATTRDTAKAEALAAYADHVVRADTPDGLTAGLRAHVPDGVDVVLDPLGGAYVGAAVRALAPGGHYVGYEMLAGTGGTYDIPGLMMRDAHIHGFTIFRLLRHPGLLARLVSLGMEWADDARPLVAAEFGMDEAPDAFAALMRGGHLGKIVVTAG